MQIVQLPRTRQHDIVPVINLTALKDLHHAVGISGLADVCNGCGSPVAPFPLAMGVPRAVNDDWLPVVSAVSCCGAGVSRALPFITENCLTNTSVYDTKTGPKKNMWFLWVALGLESGLGLGLCEVTLGRRLNPGLVPRPETPGFPSKITPPK